MTKQTLAVLAGAIVLFAVAVIGALAFTGSESSGGSGNVRTMPQGQTMTGPLQTMENDQTMPGMSDAP